MTRERQKINYFSESYEEVEKGRRTIEFQIVWHMKKYLENSKKKTWQSRQSAENNLYCILQYCVLCSPNEQIVSKNPKPI